MRLENSAARDSKICSAGLGRRGDATASARPKRGKRRSTGGRDAMGAGDSNSVAPALAGAGMRQHSRDPSEASLALRAAGMRWARVIPTL
jgi:hypothetical protein